MEKLEIPATYVENNSIRLKITNKCPWDCKFCHREGGWDFEDVGWNEQTKKALDDLKNILGLKEVHYTGGEPTAGKNIEDLTIGLKSLGLDVKTTSNAQFSTNKLEKLINAGLKSFNYSVHALDPDQLVETQNNKSRQWAVESIEKQKLMIAKTLELGGNAKINTVISSRNDIPRGLELYEFAKKNGVIIRFLNDLNEGEEAVKAILELAEKKIGAKKFKEKIIIGSSSKTSYYRDNDDYEFGIKEIRENKLKSLCEDCEEKCTEQFYGIRLEKKPSGFFVRLCIDRKDGKSYMPLEEFINSEQLREIIKTLN